MRSNTTWLDRWMSAAAAPARWWVRRRAMRLALASDQWDADRIRAYQDAQLVAIVRLAAARVPLYRRLYAEHGVDVRRFRGAADLPMLPIITRDDVRAHGRELCVEGVPRWRTCSYTSGGTTAAVLNRMYGYRGLGWTVAGCIDALWHRVGVRPGDRMALLRGDLYHEPGTRWQFDPRANRLILSSYQLTPERAREFIALMKSYGVKWLHAYPSSAWAFALLIEHHDLRFDVPLRGVLFGSEMLLPQQHPVFRRIFGCPIYAHYGHREQALLAGWCERSTAYHFLPVYGYVEFRPVRAAAGEAGATHELIGTGFVNRYMPMIRYATDDFVEPAPPGPCPDCGRQHVRVQRILGRAQHFLVAADGTVLPYTNLELHSYHLTARYQFYQEEPGQVVFRFVPARREGLADTIAQLQRDFAGHQRLGLTVRIEPVDDLPRTWSGKDIVVVQKCPLPWERRAADPRSRAGPPAASHAPDATERDSTGVCAAPTDPC